MAETYSKTQIFEDIRERNDIVFEYINRKYKASIVHLVTSYGLTLEDAHDIFQDGLLRLIEMADNPKYEITVELPTLLYAICKNLCKLNLSKKRISNNYFQRKPDEDKYAFIDIYIDQKIKSSIYEDSFKSLQKECQIVLNACMKGIPLKDIAKTLDYNYDYLRRKKRVCQRYLINYIKNHKDYKIIEKKEGEVKLY